MDLAVAGYRSADCRLLVGLQAALGCSDRAVDLGSENRVMDVSQTLFPRRYHVDKKGRRVLVGLTIEETFEFEQLDVTDRSGERGYAASDELPATNYARRWLELYMKHDEAWKIWMSGTFSHQPA